MARHEPADLAIVTATREELTPVLNLIGGEASWQPFFIDGFRHYRGRFEVVGGQNTMWLQRSCGSTDLPLQQRR